MLSARRRPQLEFGHFFAELRGLSRRENLSAQGREERATLGLGHLVSTRDLGDFLWGARSSRPPPLASRRRVFPSPRFTVLVNQKRIVHDSGFAQSSQTLRLNPGDDILSLPDVLASQGRPMAYSARLFACWMLDNFSHGRSAA